MKISFHNVHRSFILCMPLLLAGCIQNPFRVEVPAQNYAMDYYLWLKSASPETINQEIEKLDREKENMPSMIWSVRMALVLTTTAQVTPDDQQLALQLLQQTIESPLITSGREIHDYQQFALIWKDVLEQRGELERSLSHLNENLTEKQRLIQTLRKENTTYIKKIEALKLIEQQINDREQSHDNSQETENIR